MELARSTSRGGLSLRSIFTFALAAIVAALLWVLFVTPATHAADASWDGSSILYEENTYNATTDKQILKDVGLESAGKVYVFVDTDQTSRTPSNTNGTSPPDRKIRLIYFDANLDSSTATEAKYKDFTYIGQGNYTNPSAIKTIAFSQTGAEGSTSCDVSTGLGWIICPVTTTLATAMDAIYKILAGFLEVRPVETGQDNALYRAWKIMQGFANIAFVIVFLIIIYSQLTGAGISSYGLKKLLPRLIIAALLVNLSYFISSIAIDISNILGYSLQDIFISMRNGLVGSEGNNWDLISWESLSSFALAGGTLAVAGGTAAFIAVSDFGPEVVFFILPALLVALIAVLVALVVLAARQAIIIILVILSPLAFVAYLLPNTEKWFGKWRDTFFTMLFLFPAFSVVFGGSQLAATAIIQTADSINLVILGMLVQVAPLFITPLLIKLGGGLLGRIAGLVNDPNKGFIDRTRKFVDERTQMAKARRLDTTPSNKAKRYQLLKRNAQFRDYRRRTREGYKSAHEAGADAGWTNSPNYQKISHLEHYAHDYKAAGEAESKLHHEKSRVTDPQMRDLDTRTRRLQAETTTAEAKANSQWERNKDPVILKARAEAYAYAQRAEKDKKRFESKLTDLSGGKINKTFRSVDSQSMVEFRDIATNSLIKSKAFASHIANAEAHQQQLYAKALQDSPALVKLAGGILEGGQAKALAAAKATIDHALEEAIKNIQSTIEIPAGNVVGLRAELKKAVANGDLASTVAYMNKLGESANQGFTQLEEALYEFEDAPDFNAKMFDTVKQFVNANPTMNAGHEGIGTWSRTKGGKLRDVNKNKGMWANMSPAAWAGQKMVAQQRSLEAGGVDATMARRILKGPNADNVKGPIEAELRRIIAEDEAANGTPVNE